MAGPTLWSAEQAERYRRLGYWTEETYAGYFERNARQYPDGPALADGAGSSSWLEAKRWADAVAVGFVELGFPRDAVLATWLPNWPESYLLRVACEQAGLIWLPLPRALRRHELGQILARARAYGLVVPGSGQRDYWTEAEELLQALPDLRQLIAARARRRAGILALEELAARSVTPEEVAGLRARQVRPEEVAMLQPTSGSTGVPKLCEYPLCGAVARGRFQAEIFGMSQADVLVATVQGFGPSITPLMAAPVVGARVIALDHPDARHVLRLIERERVTMVFGVPPILRELAQALAEEKVDVSSVRVWYATGMALPVDVARMLEERTSGIALAGYGSVDMGAWAVPSPKDSREVRWFTVGKPRGGTELRLVGEDGRSGETGEVWARGPSFVGGYFGDPEATRHAWTEDGWFKSGDIGRFDDQGNLIIVGRKIEVINRGGQKIYPAEVEQLLERHPDIVRAALVLMPDERLGERACAYVVAAPGCRVTLQDIVVFLQGHGLASYKLPERMELIERMPITSGGKLDRQALQADLLARLQSGADARA